VLYQLSYVGADSHSSLPCVWLMAGVVAATVAGMTVQQSDVQRWSEAKGDGALAFLVQGRWLEGEASERGVKVDDEDAEETAAKPHKGLTHKDEVYAAKLKLLKAGIDGQITQPAAESVTPGEIDAYVAQHPRTDPERREIRVISARNKATAMRVLRKIGSGMSWRLAQHRYGQEPGSTKKLVEPGTYGKRVQAAIYAANTQQLSRYGNYVFEVLEVEPEHPTPLKVQEAAAWEVLASQAQQQALDAFARDFHAKWRARSMCNDMELCGEPLTGQEAP
jgi:foldase protein PrsA